jgi:hypothetical protein
MSQTIALALAQATFYTDNQLYTLIQLPTSAITAAAGVIAEIGEPFCALLVDKDEVTLLIPAEAIEDFGKRLPSHKASISQYRLITIDVALEPTLTGFMAVISAALGEVGVPIFPFAAYTRDHIFVPEGKFEVALAALQALKSS